MGFLYKRFIMAANERKSFFMFPIIGVLICYIMVDDHFRSLVMTTRVSFPVNHEKNSEEEIWNKMGNLVYVDDLLLGDLFSKISPRLIDKVIDAHSDDQITDVDNIGFNIETLTGQDHYSSEQMLMRKSIFSKALKKVIKVFRDDRSYVIDITYTGRDKKFGKTFTSILIDEYEYQLNKIISNKRKGLAYQMKNVEEHITRLVSSEKNLKEKKKVVEKVLHKVDGRYKRLEEKLVKTSMDLKFFDENAEVKLTRVNLPVKEVARTDSTTLTLIIFGCFLGLLLLTSCLVLFLEMTSNVLTTEREIGRYLNLPVVVLIKKIDF